MRTALTPRATRFSISQCQFPANLSQLSISNIGCHVDEEPLASSDYVFGMKPATTGAVADPAVVEQMSPRLPLPFQNVEKVMPSTSTVQTNTNWSANKEYQFKVYALFENYLNKTSLKLS